MKLFPMKGRIFEQILRLGPSKSENSISVAVMSSGAGVGFDAAPLQEDAAIRRTASFDA